MVLRTQANYPLYNYSHMNVSHFINEIQIIADAVGIVPMIIRGEELNEKGFGGIYGVGKENTFVELQCQRNYEMFSTCL